MATEEEKLAELESIRDSAVSNITTGEKSITYDRAQLNQLITQKNNKLNKKIRYMNGSSPSFDKGL